MSKMSNLDMILDEMITSGQKMIEAATALKKIFTDTNSSDNEDTASNTISPETDIKKYSFEEVRGIMATLSSRGKKLEAKALLTKYGASRLSDVKEEDYTSLVNEAEVMLNE